MTQELKRDEIAVKDLRFDRLNPRLAEYGIGKDAKDEEILEILWDAMDVLELVQSLAASGYFPHEPLIVTREGGKNVVIEGNRRLAAVKVLLNEALAKRHGWEVPHLNLEGRKKLEKLPVIISDRKQSWRYLGFKHVNGAAKWSSYAKAKYISDVHRDFKVSLEAIASQIGDRHRTVQRLFRGWKVLEQAEREKVYDRDDTFRKRLAFSHLYTGLDYDGISNFIGLKALDEESDRPVPKSKIPELGELCLWLYGSKRENRPPAVESQNPDLRRLNAVLSNREAVAALRAGTELAKAFEISRPPSAVFEEALLAAKRELSTARSHLTEGYDRSKSLLTVATTIAEIADDICAEMQRKRFSEKRKTKSTEE